MKSKAAQWINDAWTVPLDSSLDSPNTWVCIFSGVSLVENKPELFKDIRRQFPNSIISGCSSAGEIFQETVVDNSLSIIVSQFEKSTLKQICLDVSDGEFYQAGVEIQKKLNQDDLAGIFILSEGLNINGTALVEGIKKDLSKACVISGGLAGDATDFKQTWVLDENGEAQTNLINAVGFYGENINIQSNFGGGWTAFGPKRIITKSTGNVLKEIDNKPALALYKKYLGDKADELPASAMWFPLSLEHESKGRKNLVRTILSIDDDNDCMTFAGDMPEGSTVQLMGANFDALVDGAAEIVPQLSIIESESDMICLYVSCVGRRIILGERSEDETETVIDNLPDKVIQTGFYSYGEISMGGVQECDLHNQTVSLTIISENP